MSTPTHRPGTGDPLESVVRGIEGSAALDKPAEVLGQLTRPAHQGEASDVLRGKWLGHAFHPLMTDLPLGCWLGAGLLDVFGGWESRAAARRLVGLGVVAAVPTVMSGASEWPGLVDRSSQRVAVVHAGGNVMVLLCYVLSWLRRGSDRHGRGVAWGLVGGLLAIFTGFLGGHLSFGKGVGHGERWPLASPGEVTD